MTTTIDRALPHNLDAEKAILGSILATDGRALDHLADTLTPAHFYRAAHATIFKAALALYGRGEAPDFITLKHELEKAHALEDVGGPAYISGLSDGVPASTNYPHYARMVRDLSAKRDVISLASRLLESAYAHGADPQALVDEAERGLLDISHRAVPGDLVSSAQIAADLFPVIERLNSEHRALIGLSCGLPDVDRYTLGLQRGATIVLAGQTSHGKTSLAMQIALHVAQTEPVAFFSVEMSQREQALRIIATLGRIDGHALRLGRLSGVDQQAVGVALAEFSNRRFWLDDSGTLTPLQIRSRARRLKAAHGLGLIVVDYLQILQHAHAERRDLQIANTSRLLKQIARELDVPVLVLSQLSRDVSKGERKPRLSDLRESGAIEQDADVVLLIHRPTEKSDGAVTEQPPTELIIAKQRSGPTAAVDLVWLGEQYRFAEAERRG